MPSPNEGIAARVLDTLNTIDVTVIPKFVIPEGVRVQVRHSWKGRRMALMIKHTSAPLGHELVGIDLKTIDERTFKEAR